MWKAERVISAQMVQVERLRCRGLDASLAEEILKTFEANLLRLCEHRDVVITAIERLDRGR